jgi:hypothetical protein
MDLIRNVFVFDSVIGEQASFLPIKKASTPITKTLVIYMAYHISVIPVKNEEFFV